MFKDFFIHYANYSLREDPKNLYKIFTPDFLKGWEKAIPYLIEKIIFFSECKTINEALKKYEQLWEKTVKIINKYHDNHLRLVREIKDKYRKEYGQLWAEQHKKKYKEEFYEMLDKERAKEKYVDTFFIGCSYHSVYGFSESPYWDPSKPCFEENTSPKRWFPACHWKHKLRRKYIDRNLVDQRQLLFPFNDN